MAALMPPAVTLASEAVESFRGLRTVRFAARLHGNMQERRGRREEPVNTSEASALSDTDQKEKRMGRHTGRRMRGPQQRRL
jgi:hypothetical protein